ncbi:MAG TPA: outer-membrane lipoprotein carrier protein LolA [Blastocatellia bacterium]|nr:outer-membrane lipoprotein carrier protein LolA [Blastocatellia bacterium]
MKRIAAAILIALMMGTALNSSAAAPDGQLDQILNNMQKAAAGIKTIYAKMDQAKRDAAIGGTERYSGEIFFKHAGKNSDKVRINYDVPKGQTIWIVGDQIILYQKATGTAYMSSRRAQASKNSEYAFVATPYTSVPDLKRQYNIVHLGDDGGMAKLELTPKAKSALQKLTLWVDQGSWLPTKYQVAESNNSVTTFTLSNLKTNGVISDKVFNADFPSGTKKVNR